MNLFQKSDFLSIVNNCRLENRKFFPFPIFINISTAQYNKFKKIKIIKAYYKSKRVCNLKLKSFYTLNKRRMGQIMFSTRDTKHPGFNDFLSSGNYFIHCKIKNFNSKIMKNLNFNYPYELKSKFIKHKLKTIAGFHTRNAPHRAHEWIHNLGLKKCDGLLIQPFVGQFKKNEYKEKIIIKSNLKLVKEIYRRKKYFFWNSKCISKICRSSRGSPSCNYKKKFWLYTFFGWKRSCWYWKILFQISVTKIM